MATLLFVYGTLMRGEQQNALLAGATFAGETCTAPRYELMRIGAYPALVEGGGTAVRGELWRVPADALAQIDRYEGKAFRRAPVELDDGASAQAYLFLPEQARAATRIASGDWKRRT